MVSASSVSGDICRHSPANDHKHESLSQLLLCPNEQCRRRALVALGRTPKNPKSIGQLEANASFGWLDADERVPGHLRDPHLPSFD